jgi:hypothetical protein
MGIETKYNNGHITREALFDLFCETPDGVVILDDVSHILNKNETLDILLAALGSQADSDVRKIVCRSSTRKNAGKPEEVDFTGGVVIISNITLGNHKLHQPLLGRTFPHEHDLTDDEMEALYSIIAKDGYTLARKGRTYILTPMECKETAAFVWETCKELEFRPNVRHLVEMAFKCRIDRESEYHWKTLVSDGLKEAKKLEASKATEVSETEPGIEVLIECIQEATSKKDAKDRWMEATGKSRASFFRQLKLLSPSTIELYEKLDEPEAPELKTKRSEDQQFFRDMIEYTNGIFEDQGIPIVQSSFLSGVADEEVFLASLREHPDLWEWYSNLPPVSFSEAMEQKRG